MAAADIEGGSLWTDALRAWLTGHLPGQPRKLRVARTIQPVLLMGRNITSETQAADDIVDTDGRLKVAMGALGGATATTAWVPGNFIVGQYALVSTGEIAGNVVANLVASLSPTTPQLWELLSVLISANVDATVASRIINLQINTGLPAVTTPTPLDFALVGPTLTASQKGKLYVPYSPGQIQLNDNGTVTQSNTNPLPMLVADTVSIADSLTAGVAGDVHLVAAVLRRVA